MAIESIKIVFTFVIIVQFLFLFIVFLPLAKAAHKNTHLRSTKLDWPDISIVLIVKNELAHLTELIPLLLQLEYKGNFDIHILDDASADGTLEYIKQKFNTHKQVNLHVSNHGVSVGKKKRLLDLAGMETFALLLFTDADCRPGPRWLDSMATKADHNQMVLGFSPYYDDSNPINKLIQFETRLTALMYMGLANIGRAYMGVGRNMLYAKSVLNSSVNLKKYKDLLSGDDDLTVNELRNKLTPVIHLAPESFVYSFPKTTTAAWIAQKQRHASTAKYYHFSDQVVLFLFYSTYVAWWVCILFLILIDFRLAIIGLLTKAIWYILFQYLNRKIFKYVFTWNKMISADLMYVFFLVYLFPAATIKKILHW